MADGAAKKSLNVVYICTTFPVLTETFLQREVLAMTELGVRLEIHSLHRGASSFEGIPVRVFSKWKLLSLFWRLPAEWARNPRICWSYLHRLLTINPPSLLNFGENMLGIGFALVSAGEFRRRKPDLFHGVWSSLPGMAAWLLHDLTGVPFTTGAHAYDIFEHGGDWFAREKLGDAARIHTSTFLARDRVLELSPGNERVRLIRRGLNRLPQMGMLRLPGSRVRIVCVARLVEKKGFWEQLAIYRALKQARIEFSARIIGDGPLRSALSDRLRQDGLADNVTLVGAVSNEAVWDEIADADILFHTGRVAASGDRDGLPNVIPEAMAAGVIVVSSDGGGPMEVIRSGETGFACPLEDAEAWVATVRRLMIDADLAVRVREAARQWTEREFDARKNAERLLAEWCSVAKMETTE